MEKKELVFLEKIYYALEENSELLSKNVKLLKKNNDRLRDIWECLNAIYNK
jgi:hypothetical protein